MGFQAIAFFLAFALPITFVDRLHGKKFALSTKRTLTITAVCLGALPLLLVDFSGAFLQFIHVIRLAYLVFAVVFIVVVDRVHVIDAKRSETWTSHAPSADE